MRQRQLDDHEQLLEDIRARLSWSPLQLRIERRDCRYEHDSVVPLEQPRHCQRWWLAEDGHIIKNVKKKKILRLVSEEDLFPPGN